ncbi:hypothetical protein QMK17_23835 [Rhodococcus sp. G-MC3]|uniref:hypothetical protein n=1 Tax=Rhodococcus sp. G-MC3 TaxID=3046209 RepID=UPI0024B92138|nr:hypothetical protein [Rhodococcus sp. G-MC3]MDJ0396340.1 hypothetical protein [Rhodococcus sp. G-MC3]
MEFGAHAHAVPTLPATGSITAIAAVLLTAGGEDDNWEAEVFEALSRTSSATHLHFVLPRATSLALHLGCSLSGAFGAFTGEVPVNADADTVVEKLAAQLVSTTRGWSWSHNPSVLAREKNLRGKPCYIVGFRRRPLCGLWLKALHYKPIS